jgi:hypothetical protein
MRYTNVNVLFSYTLVWIIGFILIAIIKLIHLITFSVVGEHRLSLTSIGLEKILSRSSESTDNNPSLSLISRLWLGLGFNAFTCGLMLGTIIYHFIPHVDDLFSSISKSLVKHVLVFIQIYDVPNENFDYVYLLRATIIFFGVYLFFIVEKLLRFRFKIDEVVILVPIDAMVMFVRF